MSATLAQSSGRGGGLDQCLPAGGGGLQVITAREAGTRQRREAKRWSTGAWKYMTRDEMVFLAALRIYGGDNGTFSEKGSNGFYPSGSALGIAAKEQCSLPAAQIACRTYNFSPADQVARFGAVLW